MFVHLHCHSHYSFLRGVAPPEEIIAAAVEQKMPAVALTDTNGLYAAVPFYQAAKAAGVKPIVGVVIDVEFRVSHSAARNSKNENRHSQSRGNGAAGGGYGGVQQLVPVGNAAAFGNNGVGEEQKLDPEQVNDGRPVTLEELAKHSKGVIALCPLPTRMHDADDS